jgi:hypothetical protein
VCLKWEGAPCSAATGGRTWAYLDELPKFFSGAFGLAGVKLSSGTQNMDLRCDDGNGLKALSRIRASALGYL